MSVNRLRWPVQVGAFCRKELADVLRQPRTLLVMVLGPFLVMAAFGLGYSDSPPQLRTVFVAAPDSPFREQVERYSGEFADFVEFEGIVDDQATADRLLRDAEVDVVVAFPDDPLAHVLDGEQATLLVTHTRLDPIEQTAIFYVSQLAVDEVNATLLSRIVATGQEEAEGVGDLVTGAQQLIDTLAAGGVDAARVAELADSLDAIALLSRSAGSLGDSAESEAQREVADELERAASGVEAALAADPVDEEQLATALQAAEQVLTDERLTALVEIDPNVLVQPLRREVQVAVEEITDVTDWYAPAAIVLMLQQFAIAFGALSFVRERQLGIEEVYRVAPVGGTSSVLGKYLAYLALGAAIAAALTALVTAALGVPLVGGIGDLTVAMLLTLFASVGLGFVISLIARSDAQAVQYTMLVLLASLFFSGFFLALDQLRGPSTWIAYALPASYGMRLLRDTMLRGAALDVEVVAGLAAYGTVLFLIALLGARRRMTHA